MDNDNTPSLPHRFFKRLRPPGPSSSRARTVGKIYRTSSGHQTSKPKIRDDTGHEMAPCLERVGEDNVLYWEEVPQPTHLRRVGHTALSSGFTQGKLYEIRRHTTRCDPVIKYDEGGEYAVEERSIDGSSWEWVDPTDCPLSAKEAEEFVHAMNKLESPITVTYTPINPEEIPMKPLKLETVLMLNDNPAKGYTQENLAAMIRDRQRAKDDLESLNLPNSESVKSKLNILDRDIDTLVRVMDDNYKAESAKEK